MIVILGLLIGLLILGAGLYYFAKNKQDAESRRIYGITSVVGAAVAVVCAVLLVV